MEDGKPPPKMSKSKSKQAVREKSGLVEKQPSNTSNGESKSEVSGPGIRRRKTISGGKMLTILEAPKENTDSQLSVSVQSQQQQSRRTSVLLDPSMPSSINIQDENPELEYSLGLVRSSKKSQYQSSTMPLALQIRPHKQPMSTKSFQSTLEEIDIRQVPTIKRQSKESTFVQKHRFPHERLDSFASPLDNEQELTKTAGDKRKDQSEERSKRALANIPEEQPGENSTSKEKNKKRSRKKSKNRKKRGKSAGNSEGGSGGSISDAGSSLSDQGSLPDSRKSEKSSNNSSNVVGRVQYYNELDGKYYDVDPLSKDGLKRDHLSQSAFRSNGTSSQKGEDAVNPNENNQGIDAFQSSVETEALNATMSESKMTGPGDEDKKAKINALSELLKNEVVVFILPNDSEDEGGTTDGQGPSTVENTSEIPINVDGPKQSEMNDQTSDQQLSEKNGLQTKGSTAAASIILNGLELPGDGNSRVGGDLVSSASGVGGVGGSGVLGGVGGSGVLSGVGGSGVLGGVGGNGVLGGVGGSGVLGGVGGSGVLGGVGGSGVLSGVGGSGVLGGVGGSGVLGGVGGSGVLGGVGGSGVLGGVGGSGVLGGVGGSGVLGGVGGSGGLGGVGGSGIVAGVGGYGVLAGGSESGLYDQYYYQSTGQSSVRAFSGNGSLTVNCVTDGSKSNAYICDLPPILPNNQSCEASTIDLSFRVRVTNRCRCNNSNCPCRKNDIVSSKNCVVTLMEPSKIAGSQSGFLQPQFQNMSANRQLQNGGLSDISQLDANLLMKVILNPELESQLQGPARQAMEQYIAPLTTFLVDHLGMNCPPQTGEDQRYKGNNMVKASMGLSSIPPAVESTSQEFFRVSNNQNQNVSQNEEPILKQLSRFFPSMNLPIVLTEQLLALNYHEPNAETSSRNPHHQNTFVKGGKSEGALPGPSSGTQNQGQMVSRVGNSNSSSGKRQKAPRPWYYAILDGADMLQNEYWGDEE